MEHVVAHLVDHTPVPPRGADLILDLSGTAAAALPFLTAAAAAGAGDKSEGDRTAASVASELASEADGAWARGEGVGLADVAWGFGSELGGGLGLPFVEPACVAELAQCAATVDVVSALECLLHERRLCVVADDVAHLTPCCEALRAFLAPLHWQHCYIPLLPSELLGYLEAPIPYVLLA